MELLPGLDAIETLCLLYSIRYPSVPIDRIYDVIEGALVDIVRGRLAARDVTRYVAERLAD